MVSPALHTQSTAGSLFEDDQTRAERLLLELADYVYGNTSLKPMSKTLFLISRCLLVAEERVDPGSPSSVAASYERLRRGLGEAAPADDYSLAAVLRESADHLERIISTVVEVRRLTRGTDCLGLVFNALLRGKIEGGEGLGTYLTPEEVVKPMVQMALASVPDKQLHTQLAGGALFGDICGGTGRFVFTLSEELRRRGFSKARIAKAARLCDQSRLAVDLARINFVLQDERPQFRVVSDSLTDDTVSLEAGRYLLLATNPPFGAGKYRLTSESLSWLPASLIQPVASTGRGGAVDPAILFLLRNLDLLCADGVLAIVLPDGIARGAVLADLLYRYEKAHGCGVDLAATVSLPAVTFALGGTVAKTSFLILRKTASRRVAPTFSATVRHVGFLKRGNRRAVDPHGNDLTRIVVEYSEHGWEQETPTRDWRAAIEARTRKGTRPESPTSRGESVARYADPIRTRAPEVAPGVRVFHVSVLDVDETGLICVVAARGNQPISRGIACQPGDVLVSCINPRHWRVAVIPEMEGDWSCSPEFLVLRPKLQTPLAGWELALRLHHRDVIDAARSAASGTSSSRQRVEKDALLNVELRPVAVDPTRLKRHRTIRLAHYEERIKEADAYNRLHEGGGEFEY